MHILTLIDGIAKYFASVHTTPPPFEDVAFGCAAAYPTRQPFTPRPRMPLPLIDAK